ncbi:MAG: SusC/RagA family TonB-linked outer membrane protein [Bacteroides sp.]|nr:SusC/RagA family TonB-linked outer membrane protein [Bacteroides sp.]MCM1447549.1 SusC/RagA family TonB-linked outer membrane protein [Bacteroides sp.]
MKKRLSLMLLCMVATFVAWAQTVINGTVVDASDGEPLPGASVKVKGTQQGVLTDANGKFKMNVEAGTQLIFSFMGMETVAHPAKNGMRVEMRHFEEVMDELMVMAFGKAKKSAFTGSAKVVDASDLQKAQVTSVADALRGQVAGMTFSSKDGAPGSNSTMRIRGFGSLSSSTSIDPLIILDGAPYGGDLNNINPNDVESVTVLKDAASNALYGARGANGVIMITTKAGKKGSDARITLDAKWGANSRAIQKYDVITSPAQYYEMQYAALKNFYQNNQGMDANAAWQAANKALLGSQDDGGLGYNIWGGVPDGQMLIGQNGRLNPNAKLGNVVAYRGQEYLLTADDWEDAATRVGLRQEYNASVSSSTDKSTFYLSLGHLKNEGIVANSDFQRFTGRLRADYQAKRWLRVGGSASFAHYTTNSLNPNYNGADASTSNIWAFTNNMAPIYPLYLRDGNGNIMVDGNGIKIMDYGDRTNAGCARPFISNSNPLQEQLLNTRRNVGNAFSANGFADITFMPGLTLTVNGTANLDETRGNIVYNPYYGQFSSSNGSVTVQHSRTFNYNWQQILNYTTTIRNHHNLNVIVGHEYYRNTLSLLSGSKTNMFSPDNIELDGSVVDSKGARSYQRVYNNEGIFARAQYDYQEKIFASASYRRDASSKFHPDHRWGNFWSLGAAWLINKENWFNAKWVDELKVKASYGEQGNDNIPYYLYTDQYRIVNSSDQVGVSFDVKGTKDITWEKQGNFNTGVEFAFWNRRFTGSVEYYYRKTRDMLFFFSAAPSLGYNGYYDNIGSMYNTGLELDLNGDIIRTKDFTWSVRLNGATLKNRIVSLPGEKKTTVRYDANGKAYEGYASNYAFISEGLPMYTWTMREYAGVNENGESTWWKNVYEQDADHNDIVDAYGHKNVIDRVRTTRYADADEYVTNISTMPKFYGGFGTTLNYKGFDFTINFSYQLGGKTVDSGYATFMAGTSSGNVGTNFHKDLLNAWTPENSNSDIPRFQYGDQNVGSMSTRFLTSSNYLNIDNINIGYTIPKKLAFINSLRLYASIENVCYVSARKGFDPRQSFQSRSTSGADIIGVSGSTYSPMRTISGGITVTF